jgi:ABC-2 type transport system permease protein
LHSIFNSSNLEKTMFSLVKKELGLFFSNLSGYLISCLFLLITGLFLWVIPGNWNVFSSGYATMDGLFELAPWLYLFLIPAVSMRLFSDEYRVGTIELLVTSPLSSWKIVGGKYLSGLIVVLLSLLPTLIYFYSVYRMASPVGNVDVGAIMGSYIGLFCLACIYLAVGLFTSSLTDNQIVAFLLALVICYLLYSGFDFMALVFTGKLAQFIPQLGIAEHYDALSRGVVDIIDVVYYLSVTGVFLYFTKLRIER